MNKYGAGLGVPGAYSGEDFWDQNTSKKHINFSQFLKK